MNASKHTFNQENCNFDKLLHLNSHVFCSTINFAPDALLPVRNCPTALTEPKIDKVLRDNQMHMVDFLSFFSTHSTMSFGAKMRKGISVKGDPQN